MVNSNYENKITYNCIELSRWPKDLDCETLLSLVVTATRMIPKSCHLSVKENAYGDVHDIAIVEYESEAKAVRSVDKLKRATFTKCWNITIIQDPLNCKPS